MKQKIVIKVQMNCDKCTRKALKIACKANGVTSVAIEGSDRDRLVVIGEGVDSANLTCSLRKKLCYAALLSVDEVKAKPAPEPKPKPNPEPKPDVRKPSSTCSCGCPQLPICLQYAPYPMLCEARVYDYTSSPSYCPIM